MTIEIKIKAKYGVAAKQKDISVLAGFAEDATVAVFLYILAHIAITAHPPAAAIRDANCGVPIKFINQSKMDIDKAVLRMGNRHFLIPSLPL